MIWSEFKYYKIYGVIFTLLILASCGGSSTPPVATGSSVPAPVPPTSSPPIKTPIVYDTPEYHENYVLAQINADAAYESGISGAGVLVAVIDSGVTEVGELQGKLHPNSTNVVTNNPADSVDFDGHGTFIASLIAGRKDYNSNNSPFNMHGVAFNAQILAINTTTEASCADDDCAFFHSDLAKAYDYAIANNVDIINMSLGGPDPSAGLLASAIERAVNADILIVLPAGNITSDDPDGTGESIQRSSEVAYEPWANNQIIVAGSLDQNGQLSDYSYKAGEAAKDVYLVAGGSGLTGADYESTPSSQSYLFGSGTSNATAIISGAAALLKEAFPNLSASQIGTLLLTTATDLGDPGVDAVYGRGLINIEAALSPQGTMSIAGTGFGGGTIVGTNGMMSGQNLLIAGGAFGADISYAKSLNDVMVLDDYERSFSADLTKGIILSQNNVNLEGTLNGSTDHRNQTLAFDDKTTLKLAWRSDERFVEIDNRYFKHHRRQEQRADNLRMSLSYNINDQEQAKFSAGMSLAEMLEDYRPDDYIAPNKHGFSSLLSPNGSKALSYKSLFGDNTTYEIAFAHTDVRFDPRLFSQDIRVNNSFVLNRLSHQIDDNMKIGLDFGLLSEKGSVLGSISRGILEIGKGANTGFMGLKLDVALSEKIQLFANASYGITDVALSNTGLLGEISHLKSYSYLVGLKSKSLFFNNDQFSFTFSQPLRISSGNAVIDQVVSRDYTADIFNMSRENVGLVPRGRERDFEASYAIGDFYGRSLRLNILHQINPGHVQDSSDVTSVLLRLGSPF